MKNKLILGLITISILSTLVFASDNAPPALPMDIWGQATVNGGSAANGLAIVAEVDGVDYTQENPVTFNDGYYNIMLVGGDRELTYIDDPTCATHWGNDEACVPCSTNPADEDYCIEGPQDDDDVVIKVDGDEVMPLCLSWAKGNSVEIEVISPIGDWSGNGCVNLASDFPKFGEHYDLTCSDPEWELIYDLNCDCVINLAGDFPIFGIHYEEGCGG